MGDPMVDRGGSSPDLIGRKCHNTRPVPKGSPRSSTGVSRPSGIVCSDIFNFCFFEGGTPTFTGFTDTTVVWTLEVTGPCGSK